MRILTTLALAATLAVSSAPVFAQTAPDYAAALADDIRPAEERARDAAYADPADPRTANVFAPEICGKTDQFTLRLRKPN